MPQIILGPGFGQIDGSLHGATFRFLRKLARDDTVLGLHIEPITNSVDPRARTGRVDLSNRAVLFKLQGSQQDASYIFIGTFPHDEAIEIAKRSRVDINSRNGIAELIPVDDQVSSPPVGTPASALQMHPVTDEAPTLRNREFTVDDFAALGLDATFAAGALDIEGEDALLEYASSAPAAWQGSVLLDIYMGDSFSTVREKYRLDAPASTNATDDDQVLAAMRHPAAQMEFAFIEDDKDLRSAIENPDFAAWRIFLHPEQRAYTTRTYNGAFRLSGGAGTGKTVVLLHRARELHRLNKDARIVLTTFNRTLADALKDQLRILDSSIPVATDLGQPGVYIGSVDAIAHRILATSANELTATEGSLGPVAEVLGPRTAQVIKQTNAQAWTTAADYCRGELPNGLRSSPFLDAEYAMVVLPNKVTTRDDYLKVRRTGRGVSLNRSQRNAVWDIIAAYRASAANEHSTDFEEKAAIAARLLASRVGARLADHVLVDEAQDLSPSRLALLRSLAAPGQNDLFLAEDSHQRIYGNRIVLSKYGIHVVGRSRRLTLNYRTTEQNLKYALGILSGAAYTDLDDAPESTTGYRSARSGPIPRALAAPSLTDVYDVVANAVRGWVDGGAAPETIGLLVTTRKEGETLHRALSDRDVAAAVVDRDSAGPLGNAQVMTMHRSKGMEFSKVILVGVGAQNLPRNYQIDALPEGDRVDALRRERSLLYVAATRARDELVVVWAGQPSELLPPQGSSMHEET